MPTFEITFTESFLLEMFRRYRRSRPAARYLASYRLVLGGLLMVLLVVCLVAKNYAGVGLFAVAVAALASAQWFDDRLIAARFRKSPYRDERFRVTLSPEGIVSDGTKSAVRLTWAAFTAARRFDDGLLLFQGPQVFNWLPFDALTAGTAEDATQLVSANVADYQHV